MMSKISKFILKVHCNGVCMQHVNISLLKQLFKATQWINLNNLFFHCAPMKRPVILLQHLNVSLLKLTP
jgi:hypothetical protein